jgi:hypothetical protein
VFVIHTYSASAKPQSRHALGELYHDNVYAIISDWLNHCYCDPYLDGELPSSLPLQTIDYMRYICLFDIAKA